MNNIPFTSKKQFHAVSALVSNTFDIKQSRVEHKISEKCRFKNANAFINAIEKQDIQNKTLEIDNSHLNIFNEEGFIHNHYLFKNTDFSLFNKVDHRIQLKFFNAPYAIQLLTNNFVFQEVDKLSEVFEFIEIDQSINDGNSPDYDYIEIHHIEDKKELENMIEMFHLSYFQHLITGYIFNLDELKQFNQKQIKELILFGNNQQYNIICDNIDKLTNSKNKDSIAQCLNIRYFEDLAKFKSWYEPSDGRVEYYAEYFNELFHPYVPNKEENNIKYFIDLSTPPVGYLDCVDIERLTYENSPVETLHTVCFEKEAQQLLVSEPTTDRDFKVLNHLLFIFETGLLFANNEVSNDEESIEEQSYIYSDLIALFDFISSYVSDDLKSMFFNIKIKDGFYNHFHFDEKEHFNDNISLHDESYEHKSLDLPLFDWFVFGQIKEMAYKLESKNNKEYKKGFELLIKSLIKDDNSLKSFKNDVFWNQHNVIFDVKDEEVNNIMLNFKEETNCSISNKDVLIKILKLIK